VFVWFFVWSVDVWEIGQKRYVVNEIPCFALWSIGQKRHLVVFEVVLMFFGVILRLFLRVSRCFCGSLCQ
jgi:hypothetical protein